MRRTIIFTFILMLLAAGRMDAQTNVFTYQGRLNDGAIAATGVYDLEFRLFTTVSPTGQIGPLISLDNVQVTNGVFTVQLFFGAGAFPGAARELEISVRGGAETGAFTVLAPRQPLTSSPYAIKASNAATADTAVNSQNLGGTPANQFVQTSDIRLADARSPTAGSANYIQNTEVRQTTSNFNVSGTGTAHIFSAGTQFNIGSERVLGVGQGNTFVGTATSGQFNAFFGSNAGLDNTSGFGNSFFGSIAGLKNTTGNSNSFFGRTTGNNNTTGSSNSFFGQSAEVAVNNLNFATAIGSEAVVSNSNSIVLGRPAGSDAVRIPRPVLIDGSLVVRTLGSVGSTPLCLNAADRISPCAAAALTEIANRVLLDPDPKIANAAKELQTRIENQEVQLKQQLEKALIQQSRINNLQEQIEILQAAVCAANPQLAACQNHLR